jgi:hypothetical protein
MSDLPTFAISVRQPWAWALIYAGKDIENRSQGAIKFMVPTLGRRAIHASKGMTRDEYESASDFMASIGITCPAPCDLLRGGIIGSVDVVEVVKDSLSEWFFGPRGLRIENPRPCEFIPSVGALGYFKWKPADASIIPTPARWMLPENGRKPQQDVQPAALGLFDVANSTPREGGR